MRREQSYFFSLAVALPLLLYVASYFATVRIGGLYGNGTYWSCSPICLFPFGSSDHPSFSFFKPIHALDRKVLRPWKWSGRGKQYPPELQFMNINRAAQPNPQGADVSQPIRSESDPHRWLTEN